MSDKFRLNFDIISREMIEASNTNNPFVEKDLLIGRIDLMKTDDNMDRLRAAEWDLVVVDEAHKMSATFYGSEIKYTALWGCKTNPYLRTPVVDWRPAFA